MINCNNQVNNSRNQVRGRLTDHIKNLLTHRYLVILASFLTNGIIFGVINSFGVLYVYLHKSFEGETKDAALQTSLVGSILLGTTFACSALSSIITDKCGIRATSFVGGLLASLGMFASSFSTSIYQLYLTYGLLLGFGVSLCYAPSLVILGHYFTENLGLVNGIVTAGSSVFTMIIPICLQLLLQRFSLYFALRLLSLLISLLMVCALTFKEKHEYINSSNRRYNIGSNNDPVDYDSEQYQITTSNGTHHRNQNLSSQNYNHLQHHSASSSPSSKKNPSSSNSYSQVTGAASSSSVSYSSSSRTTRHRNLINYKIWKNPLYILWVISVPTALFGYFVPHFHLVKHASDILPGANNELLVTCIGATSGIGRLVFGQISDIQSVNPVVLQQIALLALGGSTMLFTVAKSYFLLLGLCAIFGLFDGCFVSLMGPVAYFLVGKEGASQAIGFVLGLSSIPFMVGPPLAGYLYDLNGDYFYAFLLAGLPPFIGALIMIPIIVIQRSRSSQLSQSLIIDSGNQPTVGQQQQQQQHHHHYHHHHHQNHQQQSSPINGDCSMSSTNVDPLSKSLLSDLTPSQSNNLIHSEYHQHNHQHNHHSNHNSNSHHNQIDSHTSSSSSSHLPNHLLNQLNFIKLNQTPNQWSNSEIPDGLTNCPESVTLLAKSTNQLTVINCEK